MNLSNVSCEYFYDEEYDIDNSLNISENNNVYPCYYDQDKNIIDNSEFWAESILGTSGNNNCSESRCFDPQFTTFQKSRSTDNIFTESLYSLSHNNHVIPEASREINYHLYFDPFKLSKLEHKRLLEKCGTRKSNGSGKKLFIDSGKGSATTNESILQSPLKACKENVNSGKSSILLSNALSYKDENQKSKKHLWKKLKRAFTKSSKWKVNISIDKFPRSYSLPVIPDLFDLRDDEDKNNRYSTTVLELYNLLLNLDYSDSNDAVFDEWSSSFTKTDFSCQFPELKKVVKLEGKNNVNNSFDYPGLGKMKMPQEVRTSIMEILKNKTLLNNLEFLKTGPIKLKSKSKKVKEGFIDTNQNNNLHVKPQMKYSRSSSECRPRSNYQEISKPTPINFKPIELAVVEENRSISFADLRPIPKSWGLNDGENDILAMFELNYDEHKNAKQSNENINSNNQMASLINNCLDSLKLLADSLTTKKDLEVLCDKFIRFKDSNRDSTANLVLTVEAIETLLADGLNMGHSTALSSRNKKSKIESLNNNSNSRLYQRMWILVEESCRAYSKDPSLRLNLSNLIKNVKQICCNNFNNSRSREITTQLQLSIFIVLSLKSNLLHLWLRSVVGNETLINRFYTSSSFLRQARTTYSNALSALVVEIRRVSSSNNKSLIESGVRQTKISKPVVTSRPRIRTQFDRQSSKQKSTISTSSSDNSLNKSKIPRPSRKSSKLDIIDSRSNV